MTINVQVFGLPRSGTNLMAYMLDTCFDGVRAWHGSKHGVPQLVNGMDAYVLITKTKLQWVASYKRYTDRPNPFQSHEAWTTSALHFARICPRATYVLFDTLVSEPRRVLEVIGDRCELGEPTSWEIPSRRLGRGGDKRRHLFEDGAPCECGRC